MTSPEITVFTPTFNRAHLLHRVFDSLQSQTVKNFEWLVIDDGSTDATREVVDEFLSKAKFPVRYKRKENCGKAAAINDALPLAEGKWFVVFDSDDWCDSCTMEVIAAEISKLLASGRAEEYCAISVLKRYGSGSLVGEDYSRLDKYGLSYVDRFNRRVKGDKWEIIRTDLHRLYPYDLYSAERYMAPSYAWLGLGLRYKTVFLNQALSTIEYQPDGISRNNISHRIRSPNSAARYYARALGCADGWWIGARTKINYSRFNFHAGKAGDGVGPFWRMLGVLVAVCDLWRIRVRRR